MQNFILFCFYTVVQSKKNTFKMSVSCHHEKTKELKELDNFAERNKIKSASDSNLLVGTASCGGIC